ncbi:hypothetical protein VTK26DRAFT_9397 [Humicola hyalothermophila]
MVMTDTDCDTGGGRRSSLEKKPVIVSDAEGDSNGKGFKESRGRSAFERLPDEIIEQILQATDSNGFASLALLNTKWRSVAQQAHLYAHHLAGCPSYAASHKDPPKAASDDDLPKLRRLFAKEVKRNLFEAYLRPTRTIIQIVSNSISSSSCPGGEGIQFSFSPRGHHLLAYNSSRIHVVDLRGSEVAVKREFKILRRPAATCINDEGTVLAVLLTEMQIDVYDLTQTPPKRTQSMLLDNSPRAIALSPCGSVLAAAYAGGIEVTSMNPGALPTERRAVKCDAVDSLTFSFDGTQILGTTVQSPQPNTVILTAPYYDPASHMGDDENISALWTTSILFPNTSRDCSHAVLIQNGRHEEAAWAFTYDRSFETFRAVRIDDLRNGTTYFTGPIPAPNSQAKLLPSTLPAASYYGEIVSAGFQGKEIWLYGVPEDLDAVPDTANAATESGSGSGGLVRGNSGRSSARLQDSRDSARVPQWQILCDKLRNTFVAGSKVAELEGVNTVKFVANFADSCMKERLIVGARGAVPNICVTDDEGIDFVDGGRMIILDFDYGVEDGTTRECVIEVGTKEPEILEEEHRDMATEVAIVRRRTVAQRRGSRGAAVMRALTTASRPPPLPTQRSTSAVDDDDDPLVPRRIGVPPTRAAEPSDAADDTESILSEDQEALDAPYEHASPRSGTTLRRAATAAANTRRLHPSAAAAGHIVYRRADGRAEHPHESDADNWVPPPPPYQKEDPCDLPAFLRHAAVLPIAGPVVQPQPHQPPQQQLQQQPQGLDRQAARNSSASMYHEARRVQSNVSLNRHSSPVPPVPPLPSLSNIPPVPPVPALPPGVAGSPSTRPAQVPSHGRGGSSGAQSLHEGPRPSSRSSRYLEGENIYDVSPPDSPAMAPVAHRVSREPSDNRPTQQPIQPNIVPPQTNGQGDASTATGTRTDGVPPDAAFAGNDTSPRRVSVSRTWPLHPITTAVNTPTAGYPYSAPPIDSNGAISQSFPPPPRPDQMSRFSHGAGAPRPPSGDFQLPPRMPAADEVSDSERSWRRTSSYQRPVSQQQHYSFPRQQVQQQAQFHQYNARTTLHEPHPRRARDVISPVPPNEDMPLIISTPKGVSGAFDPPDSNPPDPRAETPLFSPVPRHPRPATQASILRPPPDHLPQHQYQQQQEEQQRVEGIYAASPYHQHHFLQVPPAPGSTSTGMSRRLSSISRKPSRAERSAAKNVADAKKRGWVPGRSKSTKSTKGKEKEKVARMPTRRRKKKKDFDAASTAGWTDVTTYSARSTIFSRAGHRRDERGGDVGVLAAGAGGRNGAGEGGNAWTGGAGIGYASVFGDGQVVRDRDKRCIVM